MAETLTEGQGLGAEFYEDIAIRLGAYAEFFQLLSKIEASALNSGDPAAISGLSSVIHEYGFLLGQVTEDVDQASAFIHKKFTLGRSTPELAEEFPAWAVRD